MFLLALFYIIFEGQFMNYWVDFLRNDNGNVWDNILIEFFNTTDFS